MEMKSFAWSLGCGEGEGARKVARSTARVRSKDAGGSFAPHSQLSTGKIGGPGGLKLPGVLGPLTSSDDDDGEAKGRDGGGSDKVRNKDAGGSFTPHSQLSTGKVGGPGGLKLPGMLSPLTSSDDDDGEAKGREGGGSDKGCSTHEDDDDCDEEEEEGMADLELGKRKSVHDSARLLQILNSFTPEQTSRYESYRRSGFNRSKMGKLLAILANCPISDQVTIVMCGISKMFVGELVEFGRIVMTERKDVGPIRPCHIREAYRRLKLEGKVPSQGRAPRFR